MDKLLQLKPARLADERKELFALVDRFAREVEMYQRQYASIKARKEADLKQRSGDAQNALEKLTMVQKKAQTDALKDFNSRLSIRNQRIAACQSQTAEAIRTEEEQLAKKEHREREYLEYLRAEEEETLCRCRSVRDQNQESYEKLDRYLGKNLKGENRLQKLVADLDRNVTFASADDAVRFMSGLGAQTGDLFDMIAELWEFLPSRVLAAPRRKELVCKLVTACWKSEAAVACLEKDNIQKQQERKYISDNRLKKLRTACQQKKQELLRVRDGNIKRLKDEIAREQKAYQEQSARMKTEYQTGYERQKKHYEAQSADAGKRWDEELQTCSSSFAARMEAEYPADHMNAWIRQFWHHPRRVEDYDKISGLQMNTLIGVAWVDISGWLRGETAPVIQKVLARYMYLFGTNREQAAKAYQEGRICLPYTISVEKGTSLHISYGDGEDERIKLLLNAVGMRLLRSVPACTMRFQMFDANGIGAFGRLMALDPALRNNQNEPTVKSFTIGEKVYSGFRELAEQIREMKITMDDLARQLTNYASIREFNEKNPLSRQIYRPMLMMNFPMGLEEQDIRTLNAMTADCSRWGFSMVLAQPDKALKAARPEIRTVVQELCGNVLCMRLDEKARFLRVLNTASNTERAARIALYGVPDNHAIEGIAAKIREESVKASSMLIRFAEAKGICPEPNERYTKRADEGFSVPVGYLESGAPFRMQFDDKHVHAIVMGNTGSGKTNLLHVMMTNLMLLYPPEEVMIYLIDFKYGLDFRIYTQYNLPNFRTISINNDPEFALAMLQNLEKEQEERSSRMGSRYQKISEYNGANPKCRMNRILLVVDELYELVKQAPDEVQKNILGKLDSFAHQTRAFGIHMVICGQDLDKIENFATIKNQCTTRLALHCEDEQVRELMGEEGIARMHMIDATDQGACVFSASGGKNPQIEHTVYMGVEQQEQFLKEIHQYYLGQKKISKVRILLAKVSDDPNHPLQRFVAVGSIPGLAAVPLLVGEPVSMERELNFQPSGNIWLVGGSAKEASIEAGGSFLFYSLLSVLLRKLKGEELSIFCTNCCDHPMRSIEEEESDRFGQMASHFPELFTYGAGEQAGDMLAFLLEELDSRRYGLSSGKKALWWFAAQLELFAGFAKDSQKVIELKELLQEGPKYNIHTVLWNADPRQAQRLQIDKHMFDHRVCLEMSAEESRLINGNELNPEPKGYKAVLIGKHMMHFRIYDLPDGVWMEALFERLCKFSGRKLS